MNIPGTRRTFRPRDESVKIDRLKLLGEIWSESRQEAKRLVRKWQRRYVETMAAFLSRMEVPVVLAWISTRAADAWSVDNLDNSPDFAPFPQLVDGQMVRELAPGCAEFVEVSRDEGLPYGFTSRFTGERCPVMRPNGELQWNNVYYLSASAGLEISTRLKMRAGRGIVRVAPHRGRLPCVVSERFIVVPKTFFGTKSLSSAETDFASINRMPLRFA